MKIFKKATSVLVLISFLTGQPVSLPAAETKAVVPPFDFSAYQPFSSLGYVEETWNGKSPYSFVLIQDAHSSADAQKSIQRLLDEMRKKGLGTAFIEGASGKLDPFLFRTFPDGRVLEQVFEDYRKSGELSGAVLAAVLNPDGMDYYGVENIDEYDQGISAFLKSDENSEAFQRLLAPFKLEIETLRPKIYSAQALSVLNALKMFDENPQSAIESVSALEKILMPDAKQYPRLSAVFTEIRRHSSGASAGVDSEIRFLASDLVKHLRNEELVRKLNKALQDYQTEQVDVPAFAAMISDFAAIEKYELRPSLLFQELVRLHKTLEGVRGPVFFEEFHRYSQEVRDRVFTQPAETLLYSLEERLSVFEKFTSLEISHPEWQSIQAFFNEVPETRMSGPAGSEVEGIRRRMQTALRGSRGLFPETFKFYDNAQAREKAFLKNALKLLKKEQRNSAAMVAGGFHAEGLTQLFREQGISYKLISPSVNEIPETGKYLTAMRGDVSWKNYFKIHDGKIDLYSAFAEASVDRLMEADAEHNSVSAPARFREWRGRILTELAAAGKISEAKQYTAFLDGAGSENAWLRTVNRFLDRLQDLKSRNELTPENISAWKSALNITAWPFVPIVKGRNVPLEFLSPASPRSEVRLDKSVDYASLKGLTHVQNATVISLQMEMGYSEGFLREVEKKFGKKTADRVSQATLTGGLGALMHDLFPSWKANGLDIIGIHPIWEEIKKKPYPEGPLNLGKFQREVMEAEMARRGESVVEFTVDLPWDEDYKRYAQENEKSRSAYGRTVRVRALKEYTSQYGAPQYHLDAYYLIDESKPDTEENRHRVFDTVYSDDHPSWRDYHMALFARASEQLIKILQKQGVVKPKTVEIHNEVFVSIPKKEADPNRLLVHINHSAYLPTIYSPSARSYGLLGFPEWMRQYVVKDGNSVSLVDFAALNYDLLTGVAIDEHYWVLRRNIFRNAGNRLQHFNDGEIRSTNGVLIEHWQSPALQNLIEDFRIKLGLPEKVDSAVFYKELEANETLRREFMARQELTKAAEVGNFLIWMADIQNQPLWLDEALAESGKTRKDFQDFYSEVLAVSQGRDSAAWSALMAQYAGLKKVLLSHPMVSNARRQVPYKGPEKWIEVLEGLKNDPGKLAAFLKTKVRVVIGGRTFSADADNDFQKMKGIVKELGLEGHFAFIEDYNVFDAAIMFRAMAGVVMLSDEFLEASATSMMKGVVNGAALIGVWGGAMPELFKLVDEEGKVIDIFEKKTPHDLVVKNLRSGKWKLVNGYLVRYSGEKSGQAGGGRRPEAEALSESLFWIDQQYADETRREELLWQSVSGTPKVDMREGQARAHMWLIEQLLAHEENTEKNIFEPLKFNPGELQQILQENRPAFVWRQRVGEDAIFKPGKAAPAGIFGLVNMFREISTYGSGAERGKAAMDAVRHHALRGDILRFFLDEMQSLPDASFRPFKDAIKTLAAQANDVIRNLKAIQEDPEMEHEYLEGLTRLTDLNVQAMELVERLGVWIAGRAFETYLESSDPGVTSQINTGIFKDHYVRKYLTRYLDERADTTPLYTQDSLMRAYGIIYKGKPYLFGVNLGSDPVFDSAKPLQKAYTDVPLSPSLTAFVGKFLPQDMARDGESSVYRIVNAKSGEKYAYYDLKNNTSIIRIGVPSPEGVQLLQLNHQTELAASFLVSTRSDIFDAHKLKLFLEAFQQTDVATHQTFLDPARAARPLQDIAEISADIAQARFGKYLPRMMALIAVLAPESLDKIRDWNPMVYAALKKAIAQNKELFENGVISLHKTSREQTVVISRIIPEKTGGFTHRNIVFAFEFSEDKVNPDDGKVGSRVLELNPIQLVPTHQYDVMNILNGTAYQAVRTGTELLDGWAIRVPVRDAFEKGEKVRHGWGIDVYTIRSVTPRFDLEPKAGTRQPIVPNLFLGLNLLDLGAEFDNASASVRTLLALKKLRELAPSVADAGFGSVYPVGLFATGNISAQLHSVETAGTHWLGEPAGAVLPRVLVSVSGYDTKRWGNLKDNQGNAFSIINLSDIDPRHIPAGEDREAFVRAATSELNAAQVRTILDFIFWRAPESVNETNYKQYFYRELNAGEAESWRVAATDQDRLRVLKNLTRSGGHFAVRITESGVERVILVKHMFDEPGRDQSIRNPFNPDVIAQSKKELELAIDRGASGIRIDLAHRLLNRQLKNMIDVWTREGFITDVSGAYRPGYEPLQDLIAHAKAYALSKGREFFVLAEAYNPDDHGQLKKTGVDAVYYENVHKDYVKLANGDGINARQLGEATQRAFDNKDLFTFASNFDVTPLKEVRGSRQAFLLDLVILARLGTPVLIDGRELTDQHGQLIPIPGKDHPFPTEDEIQKRRDFDHFRWQFERSLYTRLLRGFSEIINGRKLKSVKVIDNANRDQFLSLDLEFEAGADGETYKDHLLVILNLKPSDDRTIWSNATFAGQPRETIDLETGERFKFEAGKVTGIVFPSNIQYRILASAPKQTAPRSELRSPDQVADQLLLELAGSERLSEQVSREVSIAAQEPSFPQVVLNRAENPEYVRVFAAGNATENGDIQAFYQGHTDYDSVLGTFLEAKIREIQTNVREAMLNDSKKKISFAFSIRMPGTEKVRGWLLNYLKAVSALAREYPGRVQGRISIVAPFEEFRDNEALRNFRSEAESTGAAKIIELNTARTDYDMKQYFGDNANALGYGLEDVKIPGFEKRLVQSALNVDNESVFLVAALLSYELAEVTDANSMAQVLRRVSQTLPGFQYSQEGIRITFEALQISYRGYQLIGRAA